VKRGIPQTGLVLFSLILLPIIGWAQTETALEPDAIIQKILEVESKQRTEVQDVLFDAEYIEREGDGAGGYVEKVRLEKKIHMKYLPDTILYHEEYVHLYKNGELRPEQECDEIAADRKSKKKKRGSHDVSYPMLDPFYPKNRGQYTIDYAGVDDSVVANFVCHHFTVTSVVDDETRIDGDYYFDASTFQLVRVNFVPAKLSSNLLFKLDSLNMSMSYAPTTGGHWLPNRFDISGKGKAAFFIDIDWSGTEYFKNPQINTGMTEEQFRTVQD
jgi:hypothetical protein